MFNSQVFRKKRSGLWRISTLFIATVVAGVGMMGCEEFDSSVGGNLVQNDLRRGVVEQMKIPVQQSKTLDYGDLSGKAKHPLYLGKQDGFESKILLSFRDFSKIKVVEEYHDISIVLFGIGALTEYPEGASEWDAEIYRVDSPVNIKRVTYDSEMTKTYLQDLRMGTVSEEAHERFAIPLTGELLTSWIGVAESTSDTLARKSILIEPKSADDIQFIKKFAGDNSGDATLSIKLRIDLTQRENEEADAVRDTLELNPLNMAYLANDELPVPDDRLVISTASTKRMLFYANVDSILREEIGVDELGDYVTINRADLILHQDTLWEHAIHDTLYLSWQELKTEWIGNPPEEADEYEIYAYSKYVNKSYDVPDGEDSLFLTMSPSMVQWVNYPEKNFGIRVTSASSLRGIARMAFFDERATDESKRPYFHIIYTRYEKP